MRPPSRIRIGARQYTVHVASKEAHELVDSPGSSHSHMRRIDLIASTCDDHQRETLLHEALHQVLDVAGLTVDHSEASTEINSELEERLCLRVTPVLLGMLRDNPALVRYLLA